MNFAEEHLIPLVDEGLSNSSYLVDLGDGRALAVDAARDLRALREATAKHCLTVAYAADTHLHADFLSGAVRIELGDLAVCATHVPDGALVACGHGERAMTAASLLERAGRAHVAVLRGGPADFAAAYGQQLAADAPQARP